MSDREAVQTNSRLADTEATKMVAEGVERLQAATGMTQRDIASRLGYKTSVVLSHIVTGRIPIPIDRATIIARELDLDPAALLIATLKQRHPEIDFDMLLGVEVSDKNPIAVELEAIAGQPLDRLPAATLSILREVVGAAKPERRWLSSAELPVIEVFRQRYPTLHSEGLKPDDRRRLSEWLRAG